MQFQTGNNSLIGILFFYRIQGRSYFARCMRKILVNNCLTIFGKFIQSFRSSFKTSNRLVEIILVNAHMLTNPFGTSKIAQIMFSKNLYRHSTLWCFYIGDSPFYIMFWCIIRYFTNLILGFLYHFNHLWVLHIIGNAPSLYYRINIDPELLHILLIGFKNINMIPGNTTEKGYIGFI